jgi:isoamylase
VFRRRGWFVGKSIRGTNRTDIGWFRPDGDEMTEEDWNVAHARAVSVFLNGQGIRYPDPIGQPIVDDDFFIVFNAHHGPITFVLPDSLPPSGWQLEIDTAEASPLDGATIAAEGRSVVVLRRPR